MIDQSSFSKDKTEYILKEKLNNLFAHNIRTMLSSFLLAIILGVIMIGEVSATSIYVWIGLQLTLTLTRIQFTRIHQNTPADTVPAMNTRLLLFRAAVMSSAVLWGSAGIILFPEDDKILQMFLFIMLVALPIGGFISYTSDLICGLSFPILIVAPIAIHFYMRGDSLSLTLLACTIIYETFMVLSNLHVYENIIGSLSLKYDSKENEKQANSDKERYRLLLDYLPVGVIHFDKNFKITFSNTKLSEELTTAILGKHDNLDELKACDYFPILNNALSGSECAYEGVVRGKDGLEIGTVQITCAPSKDSTGKIIGGIAIIQDVSERKASEAKINNLAYYDPLTGLPNRRLLMDRLTQALERTSRTRKTGAIIFIDLDNFKVLNDTMGHNIGDLLLTQVSQRLISRVRARDTVARLGGDEFIIMLEDLSSDPIEASAEVTLIISDILEKVNEPYLFDKLEYQSTMSVGIAMFGEDKTSSGDVLKQADIAMYQAKRGGRNAYRFFDTNMLNSVVERAELESDLRKAIAYNEFVLHYQVQVSNDGSVIGAEALIRWNHPEKGMIPPYSFIPVAEESGLIVPIGYWVISQACKQLRQWSTSDDTNRLTISVNVSPRQFKSKGFVSRIEGLMTNYGIDPSLLKLEITEGVLIEPVESTIETMLELNKLGLNISLDDFGTGYSSLQYLKKLPLYQLKIDKSFVRDITYDPADEAIIQTIIAMSDALDLQVIAEGVETADQRRMLGLKGCNAYQGYLFGKPCPIEEFENTLKSKDTLNEICKSAA